MEYKVSIIIPVYNAEKYLKKCLDSVVNQTIKNIQIIIVNDGSKDNSESIINMYTYLPNIIYINQDNKGQGCARNRALDICSGEYIGFVDSDDFIELDMYERMYNNAIENLSDIVICGYKIVRDDTYISLEPNLSESRIFTKAEGIKMFLLGTEVEGFSCNKIFKRQLILQNKIRFREDIKYEDMPMIIEALTKSNRISFVNCSFYNYVQHSSSTTNLANKEYARNYIESLHLIQNVIDSTGNKVYKKWVEAYKFVRIINSIYMKNNLYTEDMCVEFKNISTKSVLLSRYINIKNKLKYALLLSNIRK